MLTDRLDRYSCFCCRYYKNHFLDTYRQVAIDVMLGCELSESQWQEIDYVETLLNVASALMPIRPPSYMAEIAPCSEKYLASAVYSLSRLGPHSQHHRRDLVLHFVFLHFIIMYVDACVCIKTHIY